MDNLIVAFIIVIALVLFWLCCYNPPHECLKVGAPYGYYLKEGQHDPLDMNKSEHMVNQVAWSTMSRGLNLANSSGYAPVVRMLNEMEKSQGKDIITDNRSYDTDMW